jgi:hypothetical protein
MTSLLTTDDLLERLRLLIPRGGRQRAAQELGVSPAYLTALLSGQRKNPSRRVAASMADYLARHGRETAGEGQAPLFAAVRDRIDGLLVNLADDAEALEEVLRFVQRLLRKRWDRTPRPGSGSKRDRAGRH